VHVRVAPEAPGRRVTAGRRVVAALLAACWVVTGCTGKSARITADWHIEPTPPVAGTATTVRVTLRDDSGTPASQARLQIEGHMSHPGMAPVTAGMIERSSGAYEAQLHLSMPGDWVFVVTGVLADGSRITREVKVPSVRPASIPTPDR
jgi:hypothetical protein